MKYIIAIASLVLLCGMDCQGTAPLPIPSTFPLDGTWRSRPVADCPGFGFSTIEISSGGTRVVNTFFNDDGSVRIARVYDATNSAVIGDLLVLRPFSEHDTLDDFTFEYELGDDGVLREIGRSSAPDMCLTSLYVFDRI